MPPNDYQRYYEKIAVAYLGIGSNVGDRQKNIKTAVDLLRTFEIRVLKISSIIETDPVGGPSQDKFLNGVLKIETFWSPQELLQVLQTIEKRLGRVKTVINGPRTIDLDILLYDDIKITTPELTIPHPRMWAREFVIKPLREVYNQHTF